jgi:hypothetical protein
MYEKKYPDVKDVVMVKVKQIADMGAYVSLLEYNNIEGADLQNEKIHSLTIPMDYFVCLFIFIFFVTEFLSVYK